MTFRENVGRQHMQGGKGCIVLLWLVRLRALQRGSSARAPPQQQRVHNTTNKLRLNHQQAPRGQRAAPAATNGAAASQRCNTFVETPYNKSASLLTGTHYHTTHACVFIGHLQQQANSNSPSHVATLNYFPLARVTPIICTALCSFLSGRHGLTAHYFA